MSKSIDVIPDGDYCYSKIFMDETNRLKINICPYWEKVYGKHHQENGYCHYLERGDWETEALSLLWDQVKECDIKLS